MLFLYLASIVALMATQAMSRQVLSSSPYFSIRAYFKSESNPRHAQAWSLWSQFSSHSITQLHLLDYINSTYSPVAFFNNGTDDEFSTHNSQISSIRSDSDDPFAVYVQPKELNSPDSAREVLLSAYSVTPGVEVSELPATVFYGTGTFYMCNDTAVTNEPAIALYYKHKGDSTPEGCANVELQAWCSSEVSDYEHPFARNSTCYETVD